jgi:hypothetical protein
VSPFLPPFQLCALSREWFGEIAVAGGERFGEIAVADGERRAGERRLFSTRCRCRALRRRWWLESAAPWSADGIGGNGGMVQRVVISGGAAEPGRWHAGQAEGWVVVEGGIRIGRLLRIRSVASATPREVPTLSVVKVARTKFHHRVARPPR